MLRRNIIKNILAIAFWGAISVSVIAHQPIKKTNSPKSYHLDMVTTIQPVQAIILGYLNSFDSFGRNHIQAHRVSIHDLAFSPDGKHLASASADKTIKIWNCDLGACVKTLSGHEGTVFSIAWDPTSIRIVSGSQDRAIKIWNVFTQTCIKTISMTGSWPRPVAWSPLGDYIASKTGLNSISIWDVATGNCVKTFKEHTEKINCLRFMPGTSLLISGSDDKTIKLWDIAHMTKNKEGCSVKTFQPKYVYGITALSVVPASPDRVAYASDSGTIGEIDINTSEQVSDLNKYTQTVHSIAHSPCGKYLISCAGRLGDFGGSHVWLWDIASGKHIDTFYSHDALITLVSYSPCGNYIASAAVDNSIVIKKSQAKQLELATAPK